MSEGLLRLFGRQGVLLQGTDKPVKTILPKEHTTLVKFAYLIDRKSDTLLPSVSQHDILKNKRADPRHMDASIPCVLSHLQAISGKLGHTCHKSLSQSTILHRTEAARTAYLNQLSTWRPSDGYW
jgi:hypothetical protein